jgi:hypothetical protein
VLWRVCSDKHTQENFEVGDKISYGTIRSILQEVKTVKDFTKRFDAMDVESMYSHSFLQKQTRLHSAYC